MEKTIRVSAEFDKQHDLLQKAIKERNTENCKEESSALNRQIGGNHYKQYKIQPYIFFMENQIPHHKAAIIRRILRYDHKSGKGREDLEKIKHEVDLILEIEKW